MKVNKEAILKQKFWILLGVFVLLWIVSLSFLWAYAGGPVAAAKTKYEAADTSIKKYPRPKNESFLPPWQEDARIFTEHKKTVWKVAWNGDKLPEGKTLPPGEKLWEGQAGMYTWPTTEKPGDPGAHPLESLLLYPDASVDVGHREWYKSKEAYWGQFDKLFYELKPDGDRVDPDRPLAGALGSVGFKGNNYYGVMNRVDFNDSKYTKPPDAEECWIAQEDFWVKRELLYTVRDALKMAAHLDPADALAETKPPDAKFAARRVFHNTSWEVELLFEKTAEGGFRISPESTIKNVHVSHRDQDLGNSHNKGVWFLLKQGGLAPTLFAVRGERLPWNEQHAFNKESGYKDAWPTAVDPASPKLELDQVFDQTNTPITDIDEIRISYLSHRNANRPLIPVKPERYGKKETAATDLVKPPASAMPGAPAGMPSVASASSSMVGPPGAVGAPGAQTGTPANKTANFGFDRNRYVFVTDQSRHLPVAFTLTVDQSHLHEILVAIANSRLRFQTTQVEFRRLPAVPAAAQPGNTAPGASDRPATYGSSGSPPPMASSGSSYGQQGGSPSPGSFAPGGSSSSGPPGGSLPPSSFVPGIGSSSGFPGAMTLPGGVSTGTVPTGTATTDVDNPNLVELTIYGIASLYERPPPPAK